MSTINIINIVCKNHIDRFTSPFKFEIMFECLAELKEDIEWKLIYVGKADDPSYDQELDSVLIGPLQLGQMKFDFDTDGPNIQKIPKEEVLGVTAIIITCSYKNQEFFRVGYYINNVYDDESLSADPPEEPQYEKIKRLILHNKPRITKFNINWDNSVDHIPSYSDHGMFSSENPIDEIEKDFQQMKK